MSDDDICLPDPPGPAQNPRYETPNTDPSIGPLRDPGLSLVEEMGSLVDELRQLNTDVGLRPYRLFSVVTCWTGGEKGRGTEHVVSETEFLPTPRVELDKLRGVLMQGGLNERGPMMVTEISPRYTESDIRELFFIQPLPSDKTGWIEMQMDRRDGCAPRRRFVVQGVPWRQADKFQWTVRLTEQDGQRNRDGSLQQPRLRR